MFQLLELAKRLGATIDYRISDRPSDEGQWTIAVPSSLENNDYLRLLEEVEKMNSAFGGWGYVTLTRELPRCAWCGSKEGVNEGGYCNCSYYIDY